MFTYIFFVFFRFVFIVYFLSVYDDGNNDGVFVSWRGYDRAFETADWIITIEGICDTRIT